jgi:hypothetical protein
MRPRAWGFGYTVLVKIPRPAAPAENRLLGVGCRIAINWALRHFVCLPQAASKLTLGQKHQNLAKRLARERPVRIIARAGQFSVRYQWPSANTNFGRARKVTKNLINDLPTPPARAGHVHTWEAAALSGIENVPRI